MAIRFHSVVFVSVNGWNNRESIVKLNAQWKEVEKNHILYMYIRLSGKYLNTTSIYVFWSAFKLCTFNFFFFFPFISHHLLSHLKFSLHCCSSLLCYALWCKIIFRIRKLRINTPKCEFIVCYYLDETLNRLSNAQFHCICKFSILYGTSIKHRAHYHDLHRIIGHLHIPNKAISIHTQYSSMTRKVYILYLFLYSVHSGTMNADVMRWDAREPQQPKRTMALEKLLPFSKIYSTRRLNKSKMMTATPYTFYSFLLHLLTLPVVSFYAYSISWIDETMSIL